MTTYNRFYIPAELKSPSSDLLGKIKILCNRIEIAGEIVIESGNEIGIIEITLKESTLFNDDVELAVHYGYKRKIEKAYIASIEGSSAVVTFQPTVAETKMFQDCLWRLLFSEFPGGVLMYEGGHFRFK